MAALVSDTTQATATSAPASVVEGLGSSLANVAVQDEASQTEPAANAEKTPTLSQPMRIYTRPQILFLSSSPMVQLPPGMPELKDWFGYDPGTENEQNLSKKESGPTLPGSARERRFRRDIEDGETPSRPSFRSTLSQPSQMGNFKHQSLRASDRDRERDRERDTDKDRERDIRDKEGHERLRHLSDKYDRDRLALPLSARSKERDAAPHLTAGSTSRLGQVQGPSGTSRRAEARDAVKKKAGEASEDWRKGSDPRSAREDRTENGRKDRDERERARSRVRDSSRPRREHSPSRRGERDEHRRERDRERDLDRDTDEDPRRWRDDGKRDERMAARRAERHSERLRDKDSTLDPAERRWVAAEDRESRAKRPTGRDRKAGPLTDDGKDRDDRRDREREREKEPAWMDTYIPPPSNGGILGGKTGDGELDGIQAWKKERKEKEMKEQGGLPLTKGTGAGAQESTSIEKPDANGKPLDEIQLFRLLMKREEEKKKSDALDGGSQNHSAETTSKAASVNARPSQQSPIPPEGLNVSSPSAQSQVSPPTLPQSEACSTSATATPNSLLSLLGSKEHPNSANTIPFQEAPQNTSHDFTPQFNPPPGSRLLAFARTPAAAPRLQNSNNSSGVSQNGIFPNLGAPQPDVPQQVSKTDALRSLPGFSPFEEQRRSPSGLEDYRDTSNLALSPDAHRRAMAERHAFALSTEHPQFHDASSSDNGSGYSANKGSRFAKFFDAKGREAVPAIPKTHTPVGLVSSSPGPGGQRQDHGFNGNHGNGPDPRAMDEIYAMLSSSAQVPRAPLQIPISAPLSNNAGFALQSQNNLHLLQQQQQQQQLHAGRLEPLYESRLNDRNFVPDGMVPGLRSAPPPRNRENPGIYSDDDLPFNVQQRLPPQQQRNLDQLYPGGPPSIYHQQGARNPGIPLQQNHYRGGPSPISHQQNHLQNPQQQRLPPGLANLGGRPPHEPSQFIGMPGMSSPGLHSALHLNGSNQQQQPFNNFPPGGNVGYGGGPPIRGPHQLQNHGTHLPLGHPSNLDLRTAGQNQVLGMGGVGLRGTGGGFPIQQGPGGQIPPLLAMRQQQQQQLPPHLMPHFPPPHMQQQGPNSQPAHDLMALLMGNTHRE
ncbi:hypothetical protein D9615_005256 [Tricholomella constricta]|uniref:Uncharacterized protein n=1 Tax=Tricholomella constricta TaxID=117010 RepID=A0A8H5H6F8_9AGAR|nr:hypothetical protein D9615_005256 [Tricholomella constricta]